MTHDAPDGADARAKLCRELVGRDGDGHAVLVEAQRADPDVAALGVAGRLIHPSLQCVRYGLDLVAPRVWTAAGQRQIADVR